MLNVYQTHLAQVLKVDCKYPPCLLILMKSDVTPPWPCWRSYNMLLHQFSSSCGKCTHGDSPQVPFISNHLPYVMELAGKLSSKGFCYLDRINTSFDLDALQTNAHLTFFYCRWATSSSEKRSKTESTDTSPVSGIKQTRSALNSQGLIRTAAETQTRTNLKTLPRTHFEVFPSFNLHREKKELL